MASCAKLLSVESSTCSIRGIVVVTDEGSAGAVVCLIKFGKPDRV